jgi:hypothetical protein
MHIPRQLFLFQSNRKDEFRTDNLGVKRPKAAPYHDTHLPYMLEKLPDATPLKRRMRKFMNVAVIGSLPGGVESLSRP